jgi:hypothetical protein
MPYSPVDPASLSGDALDAWYGRSLDDIEQERQAAAQARYDEFFGPNRFQSSPTVSADSSDGPVRALFPDTGPSGSDTNSATPSGDAIDPQADPTGAPSLNSYLNDDGSAAPQSVSVGPPVGAALGQFSGGPGMAGSSSTPLVPGTGSSGAGSAPPGPRPPALPPGTPPLPTYSTMLFGPAAPLHGPNGEVIGYYDHDAGKLGLRMAGAYAAIAPLFQPGGWMEAFPAEGGTAVTGAISDGIEEAIQMHHPWAKFLGGPDKQELEALRKSLHINFHQKLAGNLKEAGFLNVGGKGGSTTDWADHFAKNPGIFDQAIEILRRTSQEFDKTHGTSILPKLDRELAKFRGE